MQEDDASRILKIARRFRGDDPPPVQSKRPSINFINCSVSVYLPSPPKDPTQDKKHPRKGDKKRK